MHRIFPSRYNRKWGLVLVIYMLLIFCALTGGQMLILRISTGPGKVPGILGVSFLLSLMICLPGYLGARILFFCSTLGSAAGLAAMLIIFGSGNRMGWEDIIGAVTFLYVSAAAWLLGALTELVVQIIRRIRRNN